MTENVIEIFSSVQGEGPYVGYRQAFLRLEDCNLQCRYCDTEHGTDAHPACRVQITANRQAFREVPNPLSAAVAAGYIADFIKEVPHQAVSITGGEPLLHTEYIVELASLLSTPLLLETNGTLPDQLAQVLPVVDIISMDIKLPSLTGREVWGAHRAFLRLAREKEVYVKIVLAADTLRDELRQAFALIAEESPDISVILQPATPTNGVLVPSPQFLLEAQQEGLKVLENVRIIPQTHVLLGQL